MSNCILCLNKTLKKNSVEISEVDESGLSIKEIIIQHFWFYEKILTFSSSQKLEVTCRICWSKLEAFHEFFTAVKLSHKADHFEDEIETKIEAQAESILLKSEEDQQQVIEIKDLEDVESNDGWFEDFKSEEEPPTKVNETSRRSSRKRKNVNDDVTPKVVKKKIKKDPEETERKQKLSISPEELKTLKLHTKIECELCQKKCDDWKEIRKHFKASHREEKIAWIRCCGKKLNSTTLLKEHIKWHQNPNAFQCQFCGKSYPKTVNLKLHEMTHMPDEERPFTCEKCGKKFVSNFLLDQHVNFVHGKEDKEATIPCTDCGNLYKTEHQLKLHIFNVHKKKIENFFCDICCKILNMTKQSFKAHMKNHLNREPAPADDPQECRICGHVLKNKIRWQKHMLQHKEEEKGPYPCTQCDKIFKNKAALQGHVTYAHTGRRFVCKYCQKGFKDKIVLKEHEAGHLGIDLYSCHFCDKTFRSNANMYSHRKKAHPEEVKNLPKPSYMGKVQHRKEIKESE